MKKEHAVVAYDATQEAYRQKRLDQSENLANTVETQTAAAASRQKMDEEAMVRNHKTA